MMVGRSESAIGSHRETDGIAEGLGSNFIAPKPSIQRTFQSPRCDRLMSGLGSKATELGRPPHVRFPLVSDQPADIAGGPFRARSRQTPSIAQHPSAIRGEGPIEEGTLRIARF
jgi:hypothetical protein